MYKKVNSKTILSVLFIFFVSLLLNFLPLNLTEPDNVFHIASASLYKDYGIFFHDFRWETFSVFDTNRSDIWYGFHLILAPFTIGNDYLWAVQASGSVLTAIFLIVLYLVLRKMEIKFALGWVMFALFSSSNELLRFTDLRPHIVIATLSVLFIYYLFWNKNNKVLFLLSVLFTFFEVSMLWLPICLLGLYYSGIFLKKIYDREYTGAINIIYFAFQTSFCVVAGVVLGAFLRPNPIAGLKLFYYQIFSLYGLKLKGVVFPYVSELYPIDKGTFASIAAILFVFILSIVVWFVSNRKAKDNHRADYVWVLVYSTLFFFCVSVFSSIRAIDFFTLFSILTCASVWDVTYEDIPKVISEKFLFKFAVVLFVALIAVSSLISVGYFRYYFGIKIENDKRASEFLINNTPKDSIVVNITFDDYPGLFIWNKHNRYINHSDLIFQYVYNQTVTQSFFCSVSSLKATNEIFGQRISASDMNNYCSSFEKKDLVSVLRDEMNGDYIFLNKSTPFNTIRYFLREKRLKPIYQDDRNLVFKLN